MVFDPGLPFSRLTLFRMAIQTESTRDIDQEVAHSLAVREMFSGIAGRYDFLNHFLSLNIDKTWRRKVRAELSEVLVRDDALVLDVACGTGDLTMELQRNSKAIVIGSDFCRPMLTIDRKSTR